MKKIFGLMGTDMGTSRKALMLTAALTAMTIMGLASPASAASLLANLTLDGSSTGLGTGPFGTVSVTDGSGHLNFLVTLNSQWTFRGDPDNNHDLFNFDLIGSPAITYTNLSSNLASWALNFETGQNQSPFGTFGYSIDCTKGTSLPDCAAGGGAAFAGPISFTVNDLANDLTLASLGFTDYNDQHVYFSADIAQLSTGFTGNVGALLTAVPEPSTWAMMLVGFGAIGFAMRGSRRKQLVTA